MFISVHWPITFSLVQPEEHSSVKIPNFLASTLAALVIKVA